MAVRLDKILIDKLEGDSNWISWKFDIELQLTLHGVRAHVDNVDAGKSADYHSKECIAKYIIGSNVGAIPKQHILICKTAKDMWNTLHAIYEQRNERRLDLLYCELFTYNKLEEDSIATHVSKLQRIFSQLNLELKEEACALPESLLLNRILNTLPTEYLEFKNAWESVPAKERCVGSLMERLRLHGQRLCEIHVKKNEPAVALVVKSNNSNHSKVSVCNFCKKKGHIKRNCFKLKNVQKSGSATSGQVFIASEYISTDFIIDSGASHHVTSHREWFLTYVPFNDPIPLILGDGSKMMAVAMGTIKIEMLINGKWEPGELTNVWFVPTCKQNLFSSGSALKNNLIEVADTKQRIFKNLKGDIKAVGIREGSIYKLLMRVILPVNQCLYTRSDVDLLTWHERMAHQNMRHIEKVLKDRNISIKSGNNTICDGCMYGKMSRLPFHSREVRANMPGQIVSADVCGPMAVESLSGSKYFLVLKDDFTRYRKVYFMKQKSEVKDAFKIYLQEAKTSGHIVKEFLTDGGTEFVNNDMKKIFNDYGVNHRVTMPYSPQQNGAAERENRILIEAARCMLHANNLSKQLWAENVNTAAYVINRTGLTGTGSGSPYSLWFNKQPYIHHLKIFGTKCFVHVPDVKRKKLDKKAVKGIMVGYCGDKDGYRIWTEEEKMVLSRDVKFYPEQTCHDIFISGNNDFSSKNHESSESIMTYEYAEEEENVRVAPAENISIGDKNQGESGESFYDTGEPESLTYLPDEQSTNVKSLSDDILS